MKSIADFKREIRTRQGMKKDPMLTLESLFGGKQEDKFGGYFFSAMADMVKKITEEAVKDLMSNENLLLAIAQEAANRVRDPEDGYTPIKGKDYHDGEDGYTPVRGKDYFTAEDIALCAKMASEKVKVEKANDGKTPEKYVDYFTMQDIQEFSQKAASLVEYDGQKIVTKINDLPLNPAFQIDAKHIKNLPKADKREGTSIGSVHRGGLKLVWNVALSGTVNGVNTVFTVPAGQPDPKDDKFIISVRGVLKTEDAGDFTVSNSNRTITFASAPPDGSDSPRIILYHGK